MPRWLVDDKWKQTGCGRRVKFSVRIVAKGIYYYAPRPECVYTVTVESGTTSKYKGREGGDQTSPGNEIRG